jgi:hypothetical protein
MRETPRERAMPTDRTIHIWAAPPGRHPVFGPIKLMHHELMAKHHLPTSGPAFDSTPRGFMTAVHSEKRLHFMPGAGANFTPNEVVRMGMHKYPHYQVSGQDQNILGRWKR